ncbi:MAG: helix-turn-helix domain-containing protein [Desulfosarcina sp.]|nr:helix-turn-helix domain-containing protein [Desulfosarcina sp.]MBC2764487.1 hypothetical protein [Desulfosarcina sp.]
MSTHKYENFASTFHERLFVVLGKDIPSWAKRLEVSQSTIRDGWFRRGAYPSADKLQKLTLETGVSIDWLLTGNGPQFVNVDSVVADVECDGMDQNLYERFIKRLETELDHLRGDYNDLKAENDRLKKELRTIKSDPLEHGRPDQKSAENGVDTGAEKRTDTSAA